MKTIYIDAFGHICEEADAKHKIVLQGSYKWSELQEGWYFDIYSIDGIIDSPMLKKYFSKEMLLDKEEPKPPHDRYDHPSVFSKKRCKECGYIVASKGIFVREYYCLNKTCKNHKPEKIYYE